MKRIVIIGIVCGMMTVAPAQDHRSPYAGEEQRAIKALSPEQINAYLNGEGMQLAKAAELNQHPGPKHVLELASALNLSDEQRRQTEEAFRVMRERAVSIGKQIVANEKELDSLFRTGSASDKSVRKKTEAIARLQGELRFAHLQAHLRMKHILSPEQQETYDQLRGYKEGAHPDAHQHH
jgi:Spy/CpxP family protein refolding chaperone